MSVEKYTKSPTSKEAEEKASELFAALCPIFEETDPVRAKMLVDHCEVSIKAMARAYQTLMEKGAV